VLRVLGEPTLISLRIQIKRKRREQLPLLARGFQITLVEPSSLCASFTAPSSSPLRQLHSTIQPSYPHRTILRLLRIIYTLKAHREPQKRLRQAKPDSLPLYKPYKPSITSIRSASFKASRNRLRQAKPRTPPHTLPRTYLYPQTLLQNKLVAGARGLEQEN
jgi:hypothetical protein